MQARHLQLPLPDDHLMQLRQPLLALVALELGPELKVLVQQRQRLLVVLGQFDLLPELFRQVGSLNRFHVQVAMTLVLSYRGVACIRQWARVARAETCQVVLVSAESLGHCPD